jgi:NADH-quinone oxidoreductase chain G
MKDFVQISVNEKIYKVLKGLTIIQACEQIGIQIPRFCYHEQLSIAGNCRMCLIELDNSVKPVASCAITIDNNMKIFTNTILVKKAREGVMEFLLINHPLDCPICDQGGECDLQDQALLFGNDRGRFYEIKRAVSDLELGPFIKTVMTRCIHCTRCVRFLSELGGSLSLGIIGRGNKTEIGYYTFTALDSEVSGNIIDLCPVGALTSKPYAFSARPWELIKIETIDTLDSMGSNLSYCLYGDKLMRVLPITHLGINEEWLSDKTRFSYDGFSLQRLVLPLILIKNIYKEITWKTLFLKLIFNIEESYLLLLNNDLSFETIYTIKLLKTRFKYINILIKDSLLKRNIDFRVSYLFNSTYLKIKQADFCFIIGSNLKQEMPLLLMKLRKEKRIRNLDIYLCGIIENYYINQNTIGLNLISLLKFLEGKHFAAKSLKKSQNPLIILGIGLLNSINSNSIINLFLTFKNFNKTIFNSINLLELNIGLINMYEIGILNDLK